MDFMLPLDKRSERCRVLSEIRVSSAGMCRHNSHKCLSSFDPAKELGRRVGVSLSHGTLGSCHSPLPPAPLRQACHAMPIATWPCCVRFLMRGEGRRLTHQREGREGVYEWPPALPPAPPRLRPRCPSGSIASEHACLESGVRGTRRPGGGPRRHCFRMGGRRVE